MPELTDPKERGKRILPMLIVKRAYDCLLPTCLEVRMEYSKLKELGLFDSFLKKASALPYYNISPYTIQTMLEDSFFFGERFSFYMRGFSINVNRVINQFDIRGLTKEEPETLFRILTALNTPDWDLGADSFTEEEWNTAIHELAESYGFDYDLTIK